MDQGKVFHLHPGGIFISEEYYFVHTILGSCISVCLWDEKNHIGGMNHFVISHYRSGARSGKFGDISLSYLLNEIEKLGSTYLEAYIVGGAHSQLLDTTVSKDNIELAEKFLNQSKIPIIICDVGGFNSRNVVFNTGNGKINITRGK